MSTDVLMKSFVENGNKKFSLIISIITDRFVWWY